MKEKNKVIESLNDLSVDLIRHFDKMFAISDYKNIEIGELVELLADLMFSECKNPKEKSIDQRLINSAQTLREILLENYEKLKVIENLFEEKLIKAKQEFKKAQENIYKNYDVKLQEFISNPSFYIFSILS